MTDSRRNHLLLIHIYKGELDEIDVKLIKNEFIKIKEYSYFCAVSILTICLFWFIYCYCLTHFFCFLSIPPEIMRKSLGLLMISGSIEKKHRKEMGQCYNGLIHDVFSLYS